MLVGDAAGQAKPTSGGGIYTGVAAARLCAKWARKAVNRGDFSRRTLAGYQSSWDAMFGVEMTMERHVRRLFISLGLHETEKLMDVFQRQKFQELIRRYGDVDLQGGLFSQFLSFDLVWRSLPHLPLSLWPKLAQLAFKWKLYQLGRKLHGTSGWETW
jgi:flavin-dependent dehydrogenase